MHDRLLGIEAKCDPATKSLNGSSDNVLMNAKFAADFGVLIRPMWFSQSVLPHLECVR